MNNNLGTKINDLLKQNGMTEKELAAKTGITEKFMSSIISGKRTPLGPTVANIANALHTTPDYLLGIEEKKGILGRPRKRVGGIDEFMIQRTATQILKEMQESGWTQGEAELLPKYLESAIKQNSERIRKLKAFAICELTEKSPYILVSRRREYVQLRFPDIGK